MIGKGEDRVGTFRMGRHLGLGVAHLQLDDFAFGKLFVDDAGARPQRHLASALAHEVAAEMVVGREQDGSVLGNPGDDGGGVRRGDDDVGERLNFGRAVDVGQRQMIGVLLTEAPERLRLARLLQRAAGLAIGQENGLRGAQDLGHLGHETHAAEYDDLGIGRRRPARQVEGIADEIRKVLDLAVLVVVGEDDGVQFFAQTADLGLEIEDGIDIPLANRLFAGSYDGFVHFSAARGASTRRQEPSLSLSLACGRGPGANRSLCLSNIT